MTVMLLVPPAISTIPLGSSVAVWNRRGKSRFSHEGKFAGLRIEQLGRRQRMPVGAIIFAAHDQYLAVVQPRRRMYQPHVVQVPVALKVPVTGLKISALARGPVRNPPAIKTSPDKARCSGGWRYGKSVPSSYCR